MWLDRYAVACRECSDLVAVYESPGGRLALLLRQTPVPLTEERAAWWADTRQTARGVVAALRRAGFTGGFVVMQWLELDEMAAILTTWSCRWEGDARRHRELALVAERYAGDERFLAARAALRPSPRRTGGLGIPPFAASLAELRALSRWYEAMAPCWLGLEPPLRRGLVLRSHRWIAEQVLGPAVDGQAPAVEDLAGPGSLEPALAALVPADQQADWQRWIRLVVDDLQRALRRPPAEWTTAWARWLFLIPISIPVRSRRPGPPVRLEPVRQTG